jgi:hypothetical protein
MHVMGSTSLNDGTSTIAAAVNTTSFPIHSSGFRYHSVFNEYLQKLLASASKTVLLRSRVLVLLPVSSSLHHDGWAPVPPSLFHREFAQKLSPLLVSLSPLGEVSKQPKLVHTMQRLRAIAQGSKLSSSVNILLYLHRFSISAVPAPQVPAPIKRNSAINHSESAEAAASIASNSDQPAVIGNSTSSAVVNSSQDPRNGSYDSIFRTQVLESEIKYAGDVEPNHGSSASFRSVLVSMFFWLKDLYANILWLVSYVAWPMSRVFRMTFRTLSSFSSSVFSFFNLSFSSDNSNSVDVDTVPDSAHVSSTDYGHRSHLTVNASFLTDELPSDLDRSAIDSSLRWDITSFLVKDLSYQEFVERWPGATFSVALSMDRHNILPCGAASVMRRQLADLLTRNIQQLMPLLNSIPAIPVVDSDSCVSQSSLPMFASRSNETCPNVDAEAWPLFSSIINCMDMEQQNCSETVINDPVLSASGGIEAVGLVVRVWRRSLLSCAASAAHAVPYAFRASTLQERPLSNSSNSDSTNSFMQKTLNFTRSDCLWSYPYSASRGAFLLELVASIGILLTTVRYSFLFVFARSFFEV